MSNELDITYARSGATVKAIVSYFDGATLTQRGATTTLTQQSAPFAHRYLGNFAGKQAGDKIEYFDDTESNMIAIGNDQNDITAGDVVTALMADTGITQGGTWTFEKLLNVMAAAWSGKRQLKDGESNVFEFLDPDDETTVVFEMTASKTSPFFTFNVLI